MHSGRGDLTEHRGSDGGMTRDGSVNTSRRPVAPRSAEDSRKAIQIEANMCEPLRNRRHSAVRDNASKSEYDQPSVRDMASGFPCLRVWLDCDRVLRTVPHVLFRRHGRPPASKESATMANPYSGNGRTLL